jgi:hypothetical protein
MKRMAVGILMGLAALAAEPALAGSGNVAAIHDIETLRYVNRVNVIDTAAQSDRWVYGKRAMHNNAPLTPLQVAILNNGALMHAIQTTVWSFDLRSVYAAKVEGYTVHLYMGEPPNK